MNPPARKLPWTVIIGLLLLFLTLALLFLVTRIKTEIARRQHQPLPVIGSVADFVLTNQFGAAITMADLRGRVWVADIIFASCPGPCPRMTRQMKELQDAISPGSDTRFVSLTTDPDHDSPSILKKYADEYGANGNRWMFLTGRKKEIGALASNSLKLTTVDVPEADRQSVNDLFIHSTIFVVVDRQGRLRGSFQTGGEGVDWAVEKQHILSAVSQLEREK